MSYSLCSGDPPPPISNYRSPTENFFERSPAFVLVRFPACAGIAGRSIDAAKLLLETGIFAYMDLKSDPGGVGGQVISRLTWRCTPGPIHILILMGTQTAMYPGCRISLTLRSEPMFVYHNESD